MSADPVPRGMPALGRREKPRTGRGRMLVRGLGVLFIVQLAASAVGMMVFRDEVEELFATFVLGAPPIAPRPAPATPNVAALPPPPMPDSAPAVAPAPAPEPEPAPAPAPEPTPASTAPASTAPAGTAPADSAPEGTTTDIAALMAAARAARQEQEGGTAPVPSPAASTSTSTSPAPAPAVGERGGPVRLVGLDEPQVTDLPPEDLAEDPAADPAETAEPPAPRSLDDTLAERGREQRARGLAPPVVVDRPEARRAGAADAVSVEMPTLHTRDTVADAYRALLRGDYYRALETYDAVLAGDPRSLQALLGRAAALHKLRRLDEARGAYEQVLALDRNNREALTNLLAIIGAAAPQEALQRLQGLERTAPDFTPVLAQIALVYGQMGADAQAIAYLRKAVAQDPSNLPYRYNLAVLLDRGGQREAAAQAYQSVMDGLRSGAGGADLAVSADRIKARLDFLIASR